MDKVHTTQRLTELRELMKKHDLDIYSMLIARLVWPRGNG